MCGLKRQDRDPISSLRSKLGEIPSISDQARNGRLRWYGHVERREEDDWLKKSCNLDIEGRAPRGRPRQTWAQTVKDDLKVLNIDRNLAQDRRLWRAAHSQGSLTHSKRFR